MQAFDVLGSMKWKKKRMGELVHEEEEDDVVFMNSFKDLKVEPAGAED